MMDFVMIIIGLALLYFGGDALVDGAKNLALRLGVPAFVVAVTVVAFGTSAPELLVAIDASLDDAPSLVMGNIVGSNIANVFLVLGVPALLYMIISEKTNVTRDYLLMLFSTFVFIGFAMTGRFGPAQGVIFFVLLIAILTYSVVVALRDKSEMARLEEEAEDDDMPVWKILTFLIVGLIALPVGADFLVDASINLAKFYGISEAIIGLTIIAIGTSLPELATTVMAAKRKAADVAIGNVVGSNLFNLFAVGGTAALFGPFTIDPQFLRVDLWVMLVGSLLIAPYVFFHKDMNRFWGIGFCAIYVLYLIWMF